MKEYTTTNENQTVALGERLGKTCRKGEVVAFFGDLGMGKTAFIRGLVKGLGISADVASPTFSLVNEYRGNEKTVYHYDMYRISTWEDLYSTGFFDYLDTDAILCIEWSENIENALPDDATCVVISKSEESDDVRNIKICKKDELNEDSGN